MGKNNPSRNSLQRVSGQGKETNGIKFPIPSINILAVLEQEFGPLEEVGENPGINVSRMMVFLLEMQKAGKEEDIEIMTTDERRVAAAKMVKEKDINIENFANYANAAKEVFTKAPRLSKKK